jgi:integrase
MPQLRKAPGMRERSPGVWELIVEAGRDPVTGRRRQVSRVFRGSMREAKTARAELVVEASKGRHTGTSATVGELFADWIVELERKGRSPNTVAGYRRVYARNIEPTLASTPVRKVTTKMLTDLYGAHQGRGLSARSVYQIHACLSSMFTQACRWGWRDSNPAQWAEPPSKPNTEPVVPTPDDVRRLVEAAEASRRPEYGTVIFLAATTGLRRAEICALRRARDIDWERGEVKVAWSIVALPGQPLAEIPTKNRRVRRVAVDEATLGRLRAHLVTMEERAATAGAELVEDAYLFSDAIDGSVPWNPGAITRYFARLRERVDLEHLSFHDLRRFMETYAQDLGFAPVQVALRAGHDPSVAAKHYTGNVRDADRALASAVAGLLSSDG